MEVSVSVSGDFSQSSQSSHDTVAEFEFTFINSPFLALFIEVQKLSLKNKSYKKQDTLTSYKKVAKKKQQQKLHYANDKMKTKVKTSTQESVRLEKAVNNTVHRRGSRSCKTIKDVSYRGADKSSI